MKRRFARYYIQENLLKMQEKQLMDAKHISEIENSAMVSKGGPNRLKTQECEK
jgi:hypothetical protein